MNGRQIEEQAKDILQKTNAYYLPVPVDVVAHRLGLRIEPTQLGENVSGVLVLVGETGTIGYNSSHSEVRQRFTIAHEIGHYILHKNEDSLFIDKRYVAVYQRDEQSSMGANRREVQANRFAATLLMPADLLKEEFAASGFDLGDEQALLELARKFRVSSQAMAFRLAHLGLISQEEL